MAIPIPNSHYALSTVADSDGFIPFAVAKFAATAAAVDREFDHEYVEVFTLAEQMGYTLGIEMEEFSAWLTRVTEK